MEYLIRPTNNDLMHKSHKYIDRKMGKNGKWIYYYTKKPSLKARTGIYAKEYAQKTSREYENKRNQYYTQLHKKQIERNKWAFGEYFDKTGAGEEKNREDNINRITNEINALESSKNRAGKKAYNAYQAYSKTPIGRIDSASESIKKAYSTGLDYLKNKLNIK